MKWEEAQAQAAEIMTRNQRDLVAAFNELGIWPWEDVVIPVAETAMTALINPPASISIEGTREGFELFSARLAGLCAAFAMTAVLADRERVIGLLVEDHIVGADVVAQIRGQDPDDVAAD